MLHFGGRLQVVVIEIERFVIIVDLGQVGIGKNIRQDPPFGPLFWPQLAALTYPAAVPAILVFPVGGIAHAGLGFDVIELDVFNPVAIGPDVLASDRASMTADAYIQIQHLADLRANSHSAASTFVAGASNQSTLSILRRMTNSS